MHSSEGAVTEGAGPTHLPPLSTPCRLAGAHLLLLVLLRAPGVFLVLLFGAGARSTGAEALRSVPEAKALGGVSQVEGADVKDVLEVGGVGGVRPQEGLKSW